MMNRNRAFVDKGKVEETGRCPCPCRNITARLGEPIHLPCSIPWKPANHDSWKVVWESKQEDGRRVIVHSQEGSSGEVKQDERYFGRTTLLLDGKKNNAGDLELRNIETSDSGVYTFWFTHLPEEGVDPMCCEVNLKVGSTEMTSETGCCCK